MVRIIKYFYLVITIFLCQQLMISNTYVENIIQIRLNFSNIKNNLEKVPFNLS
jgi:hypothetical protein